MAGLEGEIRWSTDDDDDDDDVEEPASPVFAPRTKLNRAPSPIFESKRKAPKKLSISEPSRETIFQFAAEDVEPDSPPGKRRKRPPAGSPLERFARLMKKQEAQLSVWNHERYLAARSDFERPSVSDDALTLVVGSCKREYGIFLISCLDSERRPYSLVMNHHFVKNITLGAGWKLSVHKPYGNYETTDSEGKTMNVLINVCKFEIVRR